MSRSKTFRPGRGVFKIKEVRHLNVFSDHQKPVTRGECVEGLRPCPYVSCKYHLYLDTVGFSGAIKFNFPNKEIEDLYETCSLDVADRGGVTLEEVGELLNLTRERVRQIETEALQIIKKKDLGFDL